MTVFAAPRSATIALGLAIVGCPAAQSEEIASATEQSTAGTQPSDPSVASVDAEGTSAATGNTNGTTDNATTGASANTITAADDADSGFIWDVGVDDYDFPPGKGGPLIGSCRASEIYGAAGGFPAFDDPAYADFLDKTVAIVTHNTQFPLTNVITILDISGDPPPPNMNYNAPKYYQPHWDQTNLGRVFGLTLDSYGNIYVAGSSVYGMNPTGGVIKRIDGVSGEITDFASLPNTGPGLGNLNYDCVSETIYVSNHEDGRIYQIDMGGDIVSTYHYATGDVTMGAANDEGEPNGQFSPLGERVWAVQSHFGRLYFSVWVEHSKGGNPNRNNEVWSVAYVGDSGVPDPDTAQMELEVPQSGQGVPVSDLGFAHDGWMLIAQRSMGGDSSTSAHQSTTYDFAFENGAWVSQGTNYVVGELLPYSAAGGVDHDFVENGYVWMTGDALDFYTPEVVYGLQGTPYGGGGIETSTLIDLDGEVVNQDKTVYGDVELPIPGDVAPVQPPPG